MVAMAMMAATTTMTMMARTMATMANYSSDPFSVPCSCTVKILEDAIKLLEKHYSHTILVAAVGLLVPSQRYNMIEGEEACRL
jgi:hypothetical protein